MANRAAIFDAMGTLFDVTALRGRLEELGAPGLALETWFQRALHSAATLTITGAFRPFSDVARGALETTLAQLELDPAPAGDIVAALATVPAQPDAAEGFRLLEEAGVRIAVLTNGGPAQTAELLRRAGLEASVEAVVTTEEARAYKPHPAPYERALARLGLSGDEATLVAAHAWDCLGAQAAGLQAVWVDRLERRWPFPVAEARRAGSLEEAARLIVG